ncbi:MAG: hypothetical protein WCY21_01755 [Candidatus Cloacimonadaceae bacterium]|jgi:peptidoglycan hydrolase CwlO-like protein|nr:hypothetical protein [Candidatus Cloacimonadota bacterium]MDX9949904.1 hypothetical protein [Candidatus Syntrophosphaera sp.]NLN84614.1 hypothetical protein [Candidatus Cloacimonadota bacterium]
MKATSWIIAAILAILAIIFGVMWNGAAKKTKGLEASQAELEKLYQESTAAYDDIRSSLDKFDQELMDEIGTLSEIPGATPAERLANARSRIEEYKSKIRDLESKLASSKGQVAGIQAMVDRLKKSVADKEKIVAELEKRVGNLSSTLDEERLTAQAEISQRDASIKDREAQIAEQNIESNRMYFAVGTRKQLMESGIINRKGGILGIGKVSTVKDADLSRFTQFNLLDTQELNFPVTKKGYSVLSSHVAASYEVQKAGDQYILRVTDPNSFRKQKLLVIELK